MPFMTTLGAASMRNTGFFQSIFSGGGGSGGGGGGGSQGGGGNGIADALFNMTSLLIHANGANGAKNNTIVDSSTNNYSITRSGTPTQGSFSPFSQTGWSYYNNGTASTYVTVPYTGTNFAWWTTDYTIDVWIYPQDLAHWSANTIGSGYIPNVVGNMDPSTAAYTNYWSFGIDEVGRVRLHYYNGGANYVTSTAAVTLNQWNHIGMVKTSSGISLLCNGVATTPTAIVGTPQSTDTVLSIGSYYGTAINGFISNLRIVKGTAVYSGTTYTVPTAALTAITNTKLLTLQNSRLLDNSTNALAHTVTLAPNMVAFSPFGTTDGYSSSRGSVYFDGSSYVTTTTSSDAFTFGTGDWTVEMWVSTVQFGNRGLFQTSVTSGGMVANSGSGGIQIYLTSGKTIGVSVNGTWTNTATTTMTEGVWYHIALVKSSNNVKLYVNGAVDTGFGTVADTTNYSATYACYGGYFSVSYLCNSYISNLRVVKGTAVYTDAFTPATSALTAITNTSYLVCQSSSIVDNSSNAITQVINGNPTVQSYSPFAGYVTSGSIYFNGSADYLSLSGTLANTMSSGASSDHTVECWVYLNTLPTGSPYYNNQYTIFAGIGGSNGIYHLWGISSTGYYTIDRAGGSYYNITGTIPTVKIWNHVAFVNTGTTLVVYLNGTSVGTQSLTGTWYTSCSASYVGYNGYAGSYFNGYISDLRITNTAVYSGSFTPPTAPYTPTSASGTKLLLSGTNAAILDQTSKNDLVTAGSSAISTAQYKFGTGSLYFNGSTDYITTSGTNPTLMFETGPFTIEHWVKFTSTTSYINTIGDNSYFTTSKNWLFMWNYAGAGRLSFWINNGAVCTTTNAYNDDQWHHVAVTRSTAGVVTIWVDGTADGTASGYGSTSVGTGGIILGNQNATNRWYTGYIDEVRISKYARYSSSFTPSAVEFGDATSGGTGGGGVVSGITGGTKTTSGSYTIHTFTGSGTFTTDTSLTIDYLVVAGGGGSGDSNGGAGGGGGGGMLTATSYSLPSGSYTVTVGAGGTGSGGIGDGTNGANSSVSGSGITTITAVGGGRGSAGATGGNGGSGGGGSYGGAGGTATAGQGNDGGYGALWTGGGGGGKGGAGGASGSQSFGGAGGTAASSSISGTSVYYAGGGGGGTYSGSSGSGGLGGGTATTAQKGGAGDGAKGAKGGNGTANTGGGAGGGTDGNGGGTGGSGVVIIRYLT